MGRFISPPVYTPPTAGATNAGAVIPAGKVANVTAVLYYGTLSTPPTVITNIMLGPGGVVPTFSAAAGTYYWAVYYDAAWVGTVT